jgi:hypothetical protein
MTPAVRPLNLEETHKILLDSTLAAFSQVVEQDTLAEVFPNVSVHAPQHPVFQAAFSGSAPASECRGAYFRT